MTALTLKNERDRLRWLLDERNGVSCSDGVEADDGTVCLIDEFGCAEAAKY